MPAIHGDAEAADVSPGRPFYILMTTMLKKAICVPKNIIVVLETVSPNTIAATAVSLVDHEEDHRSSIPARELNNERNIIAAVRYKPTIDRDIWMERNHTVENTDWKRLLHCCEKEVHVSDEYANNRQTFLTMLSEFQSIWYGKLGWITVAKHHIDSTPEKF